ncbi:unnamed protein product, partial [Amoebophrya sp. A25]
VALSCSSLLFLLLALLLLVADLPVSSSQARHKPFTKKIGSAATFSKGIGGSAATSLLYLKSARSRSPLPQRGGECAHFGRPFHLVKPFTPAHVPKVSFSLP